jgi:hypothetical protein
MNSPDTIPDFVNIPDKPPPSNDHLAKFGRRLAMSINAQGRLPIQLDITI